MFKGKRANLLVVVSLVTEENRHFSSISFDKCWRDLRIVFSGRRHVKIGDGIRSSIQEKRELMNTDHQLCTMKMRPIDKQIIPTIRTTR